MRRILPILFALATLALASCRPSVQDVTNKIAEDKELSQADYTVALEQCTDVMQSLSDSLDKYKENPEALVPAMRALAMAHPEVNLLQHAIETADTAQFDKDNRALYLKFEKMYEANTVRIQELIARGMRGVIMEKDLGGNAEADAKDEAPADSLVPSARKLPAGPMPEMEIPDSEIGHR